MICIYMEYQAVSSSLTLDTSSLMRLLSIALVDDVSLIID